MTYWLVLSYIAVTLYAPAELTRYIFAWVKANGSMFPEDALFKTPWQEITFIWAGYIVGVLVVTGLIHQIRRKK